MPLTVRFALLVGILVVGCVGACERKAPPTHQTTVASEPRTDRWGATPDPATSAVEDPVRPLLWSVERDGKTSYLLGTMHQGVEPTRLPKLVWDKLEASRTIALEADLSKAASLPLLRTDGSSLRDELGPAYWKKLEDVLGVGMASRLTGFKAVIVATLVAKHGLPETLSIDSAVESRARQLQRPIVYLETVDAQFAILEKWLDVRALRDMLDDIADVEAVSKEMVGAYVAGDDKRILGVTAHERERWVARGRTAAEYEAQMEDLLYRRNASWIATIEKLHADGGGFIAVGALHLVGPRSVAELLTARGYKVTRLTP